MERYVPRVRSVEQQFVLPERPRLKGPSLTITGVISSDGEFARDGRGWRWRNGTVDVTLGDVAVFDARRARLPARMVVKAHSTEITVPAAALARAAYPVTIDPEIGANDFRISEMSDGGKPFQSERPAVAYNSSRNEYLVVWDGDREGAPRVDDEFEIFGQRIDAATGAEVGATFQVSDMGPAGSAAYDGYNPAIAYNATSNEYLVVWEGDDDKPGLHDDEFEIFGQRLTAFGEQVGADDFRISDMGVEANPNYRALSAAVAHNAIANEYLVVWVGDDGPPTFGIDEFEIFGQRLSVTGAAVGPDDFRISDAGPDGQFSWGVSDPAVVHNPDLGEYLVVWSGDLDANEEVEIFGQRLSSSGTEIAPNDFRISDMGPPGVFSQAAYRPDVAYNATNDEYLVVWEGGDTFPETEIFGQRLDAAGTEVGTNDFRVSEMGPAGNSQYYGADPVIAHNALTNEYLVVWQGVDDTPPLANRSLIFGQRLAGPTAAEIGGNDFPISDIQAGGDASVARAASGGFLVTWFGSPTEPPATGQTEVFAQRLSPTASEVGPNDVRVSEASFSNPDHDGVEPAAAYNPSTNEYLVVWAGNNRDHPSTDFEFNIYGQRINASTGERVGQNDFLVSDQDFNSELDAGRPAVAHNPTTGEYFVVWEADDTVDGEFEIWGQRLTASGDPVGANDFRISDMGPDTSPAFAAVTPTVAHNPANNEYLVAWSGDDAVDGEFEIYGQRLTAAGAAVGENDFRISDIGPDGVAAFAATDPAVVANGGEYLVVWEADDSVDGEFEIYGQRLTATGAETGANDFRISHTGADGDPDADAVDPAAASSTVGYLVVWSGDDIPATADNEFEIFGQRLLAGAAVGGDFRISDAGPAGNAAFDAVDPHVASNPNSNEYLVVWTADAAPAQADDEFEIFAESISTGGITTSLNDYRLSQLGADGDPALDAGAAFVARGPGAEFLALWQGDDDEPPLVNDALEIFGQRLTTAGPTAATVRFLRARHTSDGVSVVWRTGSETGLLGFDLWRVHDSESRGARINERLIPARGTAAGRGAAYRVLDRFAPREKPVAYILEAIRADGRRRVVGRTRT